MDIILPKEYFSWSQLRVWLENKEMYRDRYYRNIQEPGSRYLMFGSEIAHGLEHGTLVVPGLTQYAVREERCDVSIDGIKFHGYIDTFDPIKKKFREFKTGIRKQNGAPRWTEEEVRKHGQLDVYSLLIQEKYGEVDDECHLDWIVTRQKKIKTLFDGHELEADGRELELTGEVISFTRIIDQKQRDAMKSLIVSCANEVSHDYLAWLTSPEGIEMSKARAARN